MLQINFLTFGVIVRYSPAICTELFKGTSLCRRPSEEPCLVVDVLRVRLDITQAFAHTDDVAEHGGQFRRRARYIMPVVLQLV